VVALVDLSGLLDEAKCFDLVRQTRWPQGVQCPKCGGGHVSRNGRDDTQRLRQRYVCCDCAVRFDDLSDTILAGHHQPLKVWVLCLYFMGLNLSNRQIAHELSLNESDVQEMTTHLREGLAAKAPPVVLSGAVEIDEVYVNAGHKGNPAAVKKKAARDDATD
jgi:transposase-like protein